MKFLSFVLVLSVALTAQAKEKVLIIETVAKSVELANIQGVDDIQFDSHGLLIKSIIDRSNNFEGIVAEGNVDKTDFWVLLDKKITDEKIKYVNMSFNFLEEPLGAPPIYAILPEGMENPVVTADRSTKNVKGLIKKHPEVLFVVAAGNGIPGWPIQTGASLDRTTFQVIPVVLKFDNILVVGSVNDNQIDPARFPEYVMSAFSNFGVENVDLLGPGERYESPYEEAYQSGTSFAAPYTFLALDGVKAYLPDATPALSKELLMKTVYIPDVKNDVAAGYETLLNLEDISKTKLDEYIKPLGQFFLVRSGGVMYPERAAKAAQLMKADSSLTVEQAALKLVDGDPADYKALWTERGF
jgi:hypothetical protein